jgi:hypothetical protein
VARRSAAEEAEAVSGGIGRPIKRASTAGRASSSSGREARGETLAGPGSHRGSPRDVAGRRGVVGADAEVSGVPGVVSEWL